MSVRSTIGQAVGEVGHVLGLPELGISEKIAGTNQTTPVYGASPAKLQNQAIAPVVNSAGQALLGASNAAPPPPPVTSGLPGLPVGQLPSVGGTGSGSGSGSNAFVLGGKTYPNVANPAYQTAAIKQFQNQNQPTFDQYYNGQHFQNFADFNNAVRQAALTEHTSQLKNIDQAYQNGLITFGERNQAIDQNRQNIQTQVQQLQQAYQNNMQGLDQSRTSALGSISGYFSNISPYAYQSQQNSLENNANSQYQQSLNALNLQKQNNDTNASQSLAGLNQQQADLAAQQSQFSNQNNQNVAAYNQQYQGQLDAAGNAGIQNQQDQTSYLAKLQAFKDSLANAAIQYQNSLVAPSATAALNPNFASYDTTAAQASLNGILGPTSGGGGGTPAQVNAAVKSATPALNQPNQGGLSVYAYPNQPSLINPTGGTNAFANTLQGTQQPLQAPAF